MIFVTRPRRAGDERRSRRSETFDERRRGELRSRPHLIEASVARHLDAAGADALLSKPVRVALVDRADERDGAVGIAEDGPREQAAPPRRFGKSGADHTDGNALGGGGLGEGGPDVELAENEPARTQSTYYGARMSEGIEGQIISKIHLERSSELFRARRVKSVDDLDVGAPRANQLDDR